MKTLRLTGEYDHLNVPSLEQQIKEAGTAQAIAVDFSRVAFVDSSVISMLVRCHRTLGDNLTLIAPPGCFAHRVFTLVGIDRIMRIETSSAVAS